MKSASALLSVSVAIATLLAAPISVSAASLSFLNHTIVSRIAAKDLPAFRSMIGEVLNNSADGNTTEWTSMAGTNRKAPVKVAVTPVQTTQTQSANTCRLLSAHVSQHQVAEQWQFWFCKQSDGSWKSSGSSAPR